MNRSPIVIGATIAGTAAVLTFHPTAQSGATGVTSTRSSTSTSASSSSSASSASASTGASGTATGNAISTMYGSVAVRVKAENGKITRIEAVQLTDSDPRSVEISESAAPILKQEALSAQSAAIDAVSGATYTSAGYDQSLQSALDKLGYKAANGARATLQVPS